MHEPVDLRGGHDFVTERVEQFFMIGDAREDPGRMLVAPPDQRASRTPHTAYLAESNSPPLKRRHTEHEPGRYRCPDPCIGPRDPTIASANIRPLALRPLC